MKMLIVLSVVILVIAMLGTAFYDFVSPRFIKNQYGALLQYGNCPNCGDSWWWKSIGTIPYEKGYEVMICEECLNTLNPLDTERIVSYLTSVGWNSEKVKLVRKAVEMYKEGEKDKLL